MTSGITRRGFLAGAAAILNGATAALARARPDAGPQADEVDVIVVGAGSSGCVVARRLSDDPAMQVLVLEAGGPPAGDPAIREPGRWIGLMGSQWDWGYRTEPEPQLGGRRLPFPRGKVLGGCSAINAMVYARGHRLDYDGWDAQGNAGWSYGAVLPYFLRSEDNTRGASAFHATGGPMTVSDTVDAGPVHHAFLEAARELGYEGRPDWDFNGARQENGAGFYQKNIKEGRRQSSFDAFVAPVRSRANLTTVPRAHVTRLLWEGRRATGIEYVVDGRTRRARARREIVLSAGVVDTPKLLLLSGVGPADGLRALGIDVVADLPGVGRNLQEHLALSIRYAVTDPIPASLVSAGLFLHSRGGQATSPPDLQFYLGRGTSAPDALLSLTVSLTQPESRGSLTLRSRDPQDPPVIHGNFLERDADLDAVVRGLEVVRQLAATRAFSGLRGDEVEPGPAVRSRSDLEQFIRQNVRTIFHPAGTCAMGRNRGHVVDATLRVHGVEGVRIADASIMPTVVNAPTHAACLMIGERAAALIAAAP